MSRKPKAEGVKPRTYRGVNVPKEIIENSVRGDSQKCMVRQAVKARLPEAKRVVVDMQYISFTLDGVRYRYHTPKWAAYAIACFDRGEDVEPFTFTLDGYTAEAFITAPPKSHVGSASSVRVWAVANGLMTQKQADKQTWIPSAVKEAYLQEYPEATEVVRNRRPGNSRMSSRATRTAVKQDRLHGLRVFGPTPTAA